MNIVKAAEECFEEIRAFREELHSFPELGHREHRTSRRIAQMLEGFGIPVLDCGLDTGVAALIEGGKFGKMLAIREDIDALPIAENTGLPFASRHAGISHACGHDIHAASLLGAAKILSQMREELCGSVLLIFQCAEETFDGAASMLQRDLFKNGVPDAVIGFHCAPSLPLGQVGVVSGIYNASCDRITLTVTGKGGHGAHPELCVDPVMLSAGLLVQLQTIISRGNCPTDPAVLTFGTIHGGSAPNVIPDQVTLCGTLRTFDDRVRKKHLAEVERLSGEFCRAFKGDCRMTVDCGMPPLINSPDICHLIEESAQKVLGEKSVRTDLAPSMGSDDFSCILEACRNHGAQFLVGTGIEEQENTRLGLHVAENVFPSEALLPGMMMLAQTAADFLR